MSDTILLGVLRMPTELWDGSNIDQQQRHARYVEAADIIESLKKDKERLDYLDRCNATLNKHYGTEYGWRLIQSHLVNRLMFKDLDSHNGGVDLNDSESHGFKSCRDAIDEKMKDR